MKRVATFKSKYAVGDYVLFYDYTPRQCGLVRRGKKVNKKPKEGWILAVTFDGNFEEKGSALYTIQDESGNISLMNVSEEHIIKLIKE